MSAVGITNGPPPCAHDHWAVVLSCPYLARRWVALEHHWAWCVPEKPTVLAGHLKYTDTRPFKCHIYIPYHATQHTQHRQCVWCGASCSTDCASYSFCSMLVCLLTLPVGDVYRRPSQPTCKAWVRPCMSVDEKQMKYAATRCIADFLTQSILLHVIFFIIISNLSVVFQRINVFINVSAIHGAGSRDTWCKLAVDGWAYVVMLQWTCHFHSPHTAASIVYFPHMYVAVPGGSSHADHRPPSQ